MSGTIWALGAIGALALGGGPSMPTRWTCFASPPRSDEGVDVLQRGRVGSALCSIARDQGVPSA